MRRTLGLLALASSLSALASGSKVAPREAKGMDLANDLMYKGHQAAQKQQLDEAIPLFEKALNITRSEEGVSIETATSLTVLAQAHATKGDFQTAIPLFEEVRAAGLCSTLRAFLKVTRAYAHAQALDMLKAKVPKGSPTISRALNHLGQIYYASGNLGVSRYFRGSPGLSFNRYL
jgi:tetratricopeptide (TPR) repeat protein